MGGQCLELGFCGGCGEGGGVEVRMLRGSSGQRREGRAILYVNSP